MLTHVQQRMINYLADYIDEHGMSPTVREIQEGCAISSTSVVDYNLKQLCIKGYVTWHRKRSRSVQLVNQASRTIANPQERQWVIEGLGLLLLDGAKDLPRDKIKALKDRLAK